MTKNDFINAISPGQEIVLTHTIEAPRAAVWRAWTTPMEIARWWGPDGFTNSIKRMEAQEGGVWEFVMYGPDGMNYLNRIIYDEIVPPDFTHSGGPGHIVYTHSGLEAEGLDQFHVVVTFAGIDQQTTMLTMRMRFKSIEECEKQKEFGAIEGGKQTLDRLARFVEKKDIDHHK